MHLFSLHKIRKLLPIFINFIMNGICFIIFILFFFDTSSSSSTAYNVKIWPSRCSCFSTRSTSIYNGVWIWSWSFLSLWKIFKGCLLYWGLKFLLYCVCLWEFLFYNSNLFTLSDKILITSHIFSNVLLWEDSIFAFPLSWVGCVFGDFPATTKFASISKESIWICSRVGALFPLMWIQNLIPKPLQKLSLHQQEEC